MQTQGQVWVNPNTHVFTCSAWCRNIEYVSAFSEGYGVDTETGHKICYACCGKADADRMEKDGKATLYLSRDKDGEGLSVGNWPGTLKLPVNHVRKGHHNIARTRTDVWFMFRGQRWHGVQIGRWSDICHCKRNKA